MRTMDDDTDKDEMARRLAAIAVACLDWRESCPDDGPDTNCGRAMQAIWRIALGPDADLWADEPVD